jgi:hypothetical protein
MSKYFNRSFVFADHCSPAGRSPQEAGVEEYESSIGQDTKTSKDDDATRSDR